MGAKLNLINQKFDRLLVIDAAPNKNGRTAWICKCDCGNELIVTTHSLRNGNTKSCGCLHREKVAKQFSKDISNQRFGNLTALKPTEMRKHGSVIWECVCDCGNTHLANTEMLLSGKVSSCGCIRSKGNQKIKNLLQKNNIPFIAEYPIRINEINYYYDFALIKEEKVICFIEYDGILHFNQDNYHGWNNKENWEKTQRNDIIKNSYALEKQIPLIRIPYTDFDKIDLNYIIERMSEECIVDILQL